MAPALVQNGHANGSTAKLAATAKVFQAIQGHWLSACLGVLMELRIPEILADRQQMTFQEVGVLGICHCPHVALVPCLCTVLNTAYPVTYSKAIKTAPLGKD